MSAVGWAAWVALGLWCVALVVGVVAFIMARRLWQQLAPTVLAMMGAASALGMVDTMMKSDAVE